MDFPTAFGVPTFQDHPAPYASAMRRGLVRARCLHVVDGDTYDFMLDLAWYQYTYGRLPSAAPTGAWLSWRCNLAVRKLRS